LFKIKLERIIHEGHPIVGLADQYEQVEKENQGVWCCGAFEETVSASLRLKVIKKNRLKGVSQPQAPVTQQTQGQAPGNGK